MYIVKLSAKDGNEDYQFVNVEVNCNNENTAINKAVDCYYEKYWTNTEWRKEDFEAEMISFKNKLNQLNDSVLLKRLPNKDIIINEYESDLRSHLGAIDKSVQEFTKMALCLKIEYLSEIGCELSYFAYPKKSKFESVSI
jgi:uncharacterized protein (DUF2132 family)